MHFKKNRSGFSLIEVNMAILIAAGGLISLFALFPVSLRQSVMSTADLHQVTFASSFFEAVSGNVKLIDDVKTWNNINDFWTSAVDGLGISEKPIAFAAMKAKASDATAELIDDEDIKSGDRANDLRFVVRETDKNDSFSKGELKLPPQMVIRVRPIIQDNGRLPNRYAVSLLSTHEFAPAIFNHNTVYSMEFYFQRRP